MVLIKIFGIVQAYSNSLRNIGIIIFLKIDLPFALFFLEQEP